VLRETQTCLPRPDAPKRRRSRPGAVNREGTSFVSPMLLPNATHLCRACLGGSPRIHAGELDFSPAVK